MRHSEVFSVPAEGPGAEVRSGACNAAREDGPGISGGDALASGCRRAMQGQARESFGGAASGAPSQCVAVAFICGSAASMAASAGLGCQARRLVRHKLHFLEVRHLLYVS